MFFTNNSLRNTKPQIATNTLAKDPETTGLIVDNVEVDTGKKTDC